MRYRRYSYRYALVLSTSVPRPLGLPDLGERRRVQLAQTWWRPAADVYEAATTITVTVELAGVDYEELDVLLYEDAVVVEGKRRLPVGEAGGVYHTAEIRQGPFRLELALPAPIDPERVVARYEQGLLQLMLPKSEGR
jgi:HSP20 family protein